MFGKLLKEKANELVLKPGSSHALIQKLILDGFFDSPVPSEEIVTRIRETSGIRWKTIHIQTYMKKFLQCGIIRAVKPSDSSRNYWVLANVPRSDALHLIGATHKIREIEGQLFSDDLIGKLKKPLERELGELHENFGRNGDCTAFLLRKMLEKLIIIVLSKENRETLLEDVTRPGRFKGLKDMIEICAQQKVNGLPFLTHKTAQEIKGLKFLGDTAAHNPLVNVDMSTIVPQMPFMITAYKELAQRL
jgi:hypothetical protein